MMRKFLRWLRRMHPEERKQAVQAARELQEKSQEIDRHIREGQACADKLKQSFAQQIQEGDGVSDMLRNLMNEMNHEDRAR